MRVVFEKVRYSEFSPDVQTFQERLIATARLDGGVGKVGAPELPPSSSSGWDILKRSSECL